MSGHSRWAQIKHHKGIADTKRGELFSKLLQAITVAARVNPNPDFNPQLRAAIVKARENNVPQENVVRAIERVRREAEESENLLLEGYGPGGVALVIEIETDNKNRTVQEIKKILHTHFGKLADPGSVRWVFERKGNTAEWNAKYPRKLDRESEKNLALLLDGLKNHPHVRHVSHN